MLQYLPAHAFTDTPEQLAARWLREYKDGIDGTEDNAGAVVLPDSLARAAAAGIDLRAHLTAHDAYGAFAALGDLVITGPTRTNVNDFRAVLIERRQ